MIRDNLEVVREKISKAAEKSGRALEDIRLIAVSKNVSADDISKAVGLGIKDIGESRVQEAREKTALLADFKMTWHMVGHLQTNKVKYAVDIFDYIHSVDSIRLAEEINKLSAVRNKRPKVFIEVNTSKEETKFGVSEQEALILADKISGYSSLELAGFMTIAPFSDDEVMVRQAFKKLKLIRDDAGRSISKRLYLSMGMSDDFEIAIEEGADFIRIGSAIFGERN